MIRVLPILFNTDMVRAILDGRKTETRRVVKFPVNKYTHKIPGADSVSAYSNTMYSEKVSFHEEPFYCFDVKPPYHRGDTLYVRETFTDHWVPDEEGKPQLEYCYKADGIDIKAECLPGENNRWYPSIHMPKEAARIWLKVTDVRVERLQEMTASESAKEGIRLPGEYDTKERAYILAFADLWDSTIKKTDLDCYGWYANPWVWVIEFERCEKPEGWCT